MQTRYCSNWRAGWNNLRARDIKTISRFSQLTSQHADSKSLAREDVHEFSSHKKFASACAALWHFRLHACLAIKKLQVWIKYDRKSLVIVPDRARQFDPPDWATVIQRTL